MRNAINPYKLSALLLVSMLCAPTVFLYAGRQQPPSGDAPAAAGFGGNGAEDEEWIAPAPPRSRLLDREDTLAPIAARNAPASESPASARTKTDGQPTRIRIDNADLISNNEDLAPGVQKLTGNVRFYHGNTLMTCDQAEFDRGKNTFFASGNVFVNEGDTLTLRSERMLYTGDDQLIKSYGNVVLVHKTTTLRTDTLDYDRRAQQAYYFNGGTITDDKNTLESLIGVYRTPDDMVDFYLEVHAWDPDYNMYSDTLHYHTRDKIITVEGPTRIYGDKNCIYTELGAYDTRNGVSDFYRRNRISYGRRTLLSDTLHYDRPGGYARATSRVEIQDTVQRAAVYGDFAEYFEPQDSIIFPRNPKAIQILDRDTLYSRADTMMVTRRSSLLAYQQALRAAADTVLSEQRDVAGSPEKDGRSYGTLERFSEKIRRSRQEGDETIVSPMPDEGSADSLLRQPGIVGNEKAANASDSLSREQTPPMNEKQRRRAEKKRLREEKRAAKLASIQAGGTEEKTPGQPSPILTDETESEPRNEAIFLQTDSTSTALFPDSPGGDTALNEKPIDAPDTLAWTRTSDDSLRVMRSFHRVRFYKKDMSGVADSVFYDQKTGVTYLYGEPAIFSMGNQVTADTLYLTRDMEKNTLDSLILVNNAFILSQDARDTSLYNQIRGKTMRGKLIENDLRVVNIRGNAQTLYYSYDSDGKSIGLNKSDASTMRVIMKDSKIQRVRFNKEPSGVMLSAGKDSPEEAQKLPGYVRREDERPLSPEEIWGGPIDVDLSFAARAETSGSAKMSDDRSEEWIAVAAEDALPAKPSATQGKTLD